MTGDSAPRVTVVIPVFNRPADVRRAIDSVLAQTCQDIEIVVVDDGSTDDTPATVAALATSDHRIRVIHHAHRRGGSAARNTGFRAGAAPYVAFLDSDDEWMPRKLERQLDVFERSGDRLGLVYTGTERVDVDGTTTRRIPRGRPPDARSLLSSNVVGGASVGMLRRNVLDALDGFDESLPSSQDWDLWFRVLEHYSIDFVPEVLARIAAGKDPGRITANLKGVIKGRELFCDKHIEKLREHGVLHRFLRQIGWIHHRLARECAPARRRYLESLAVRPTAVATYALLLATWMPMSWLDTLAGWKHRTQHVLRLHAQGY